MRLITSGPCSLKIVVMIYSAREVSTVCGRRRTEELALTKSSGLRVAPSSTGFVLLSMLNMMGIDVAHLTKSNICAFAHSSASRLGQKSRTRRRTSRMVEILVPGTVSWRGKPSKRREPQSSVLICANVRFATCFPTYCLSFVSRAQTHEKPKRRTG